MAAWEDSSSAIGTTIPGSTTVSETKRTGSRVAMGGTFRDLSDTGSTPVPHHLFRRSPRANSAGWSGYLLAVRLAAGLTQLAGALDVLLLLLLELLDVAGVA